MPVWNTFPQANFQAADQVLGQTGFSATAANDDDQDGASDVASTARTLNKPTGVTSDGANFAVVDTDSHRVLVWNAFPTSSFASADVVLGQTNFSDHAGTRTTGTGYYYPYAAVFYAGKLLVADSHHYRVLVYKPI